MSFLLKQRWNSQTKDGRPSPFGKVTPVRDMIVAGYLSSDSFTTSAAASEIDVADVPLLRQSLIKLTKNGRGEHRKFFEIYNSGHVRWGKEAKFKHTGLVQEVSETATEEGILAKLEEMAKKDPSVHNRFFSIFTNSKTLHLIAPSVEERNRWITTAVSVTKSVKTQLWEERNELAQLREEVVQLKAESQQMKQSNQEKLSKLRQDRSVLTDQNNLITAQLTTQKKLLRNSQRNYDVLTEQFEKYREEYNQRNAELADLITQAVDSLNSRVPLENNRLSVGSEKDEIPVTAIRKRENESIESSIKILITRCEELQADNEVLMIQRLKWKKKELEFSSLCGEMKKAEKALRKDKEDLALLVQKVLSSHKKNLELIVEQKKQMDNREIEDQLVKERNQALAQLEVLETTLHDQDRSFQKQEQVWTKTEHELKTQIAKLAHTGRRNSLDYLSAGAEETMKDAQLAMQKEATTRLKQQVDILEKELDKKSKQIKSVEDRISNCTCGKARKY